MSDDKQITITMTGYAWARLLSQLEDDMQVCNRNQAVTISLWENISTQLNGGNAVHMIHEDNCDPKYRPKPVKVDAPAVQDALAEPKKSWWRKLFGN